MSINMTMPWISPKWMGFGLQSFLLWIQPTVVYEVLQHSWWVWIWIQSTIVEAQQLINNFWFVGSACQSNLQVQISALEVGAVPLLIRLVALDSSKQVQARALYAHKYYSSFPLRSKSFFWWRRYLSLLSTVSNWLQWITQTAAKNHHFAKWYHHWKKYACSTSPRTAGLATTIR